MRNKSLLIVSLCSIMLMIVMAACSGSEEDTHIRLGTLGAASASLERTYTLEEAVNASDLVVDITISSWVGEDLSDNMTTFFQASVNDVLKGDAPDSIILLQNGNSEWTLKDYPLFQKGERLIVFLRKAEGNVFEIDFDLDYNNIYWLTGAYTTVMHVQTINNVSYALDRFGVMTEAHVSMDNTLVEVQSSLSINDSKAARDFWNRLETADPLIAHSDDRANILVEFDTLIGEIEGFVIKEATSK